MNAVKQTKLFQPENAYRMDGGSPPLPATATIGRNPPNGAVVYYSLKSKPTTDVVSGISRRVRKINSEVHREGSRPSLQRRLSHAAARQCGSAGFANANARSGSSDHAARRTASSFG